MQLYTAARVEPYCLALSMLCVSGVVEEQFVSYYEIYHTIVWINAICYMY